MRNTLTLLLLFCLAAGAAWGQEETDSATAPPVPSATTYASIDEAVAATCLPWYNFWDDPRPLVVEFYTDW